MKEKTLKITVFVLAALLALNFALTIVLFVKNDDLSTTLSENQNALSEMMHEPSDKYAGHKLYIGDVYQGYVFSITEISDDFIRVTCTDGTWDSLHYSCEVRKSDAKLVFPKNPIGADPSEIKRVPYEDLEKD